MKIGLHKIVLFSPLIILLSFLVKKETVVVKTAGQVEEYEEILPGVSERVEQELGPPVKYGANLTKLKKHGIIKEKKLSEAEFEELICDSYLYLKRYQNNVYHINALGKLAQSLYETSSFSSVLFTVAHNEGGYKLFDKKIKNYYLLKDDGKNCVKGEGPYSRFRAFISVEKSYDYGCTTLLQKTIYKNKNRNYMDTRRWLEAIEGNYATTSHYSERVMGFIPRIQKILKKNGI